jgi:4-oxalocrotonate tautomerase
MPLIQVKLINEILTPEQKQEMTRRLIDAMVSVEGENIRPITLLTIEEVRSDEWGIGAQIMRPAARTNSLSRRWTDEKYVS